MRSRPQLLIIAGLATATALFSGCGSSGGPMMGDGRRPATEVSGFPAGTTGRSGPGHHAPGLTCSVPTLPGRLVTVLVGDRGMGRMMARTSLLDGPMMMHAFPASVPAGEVSFSVANMGSRTHELVVLPLAAGQVAGQRVPGPDGRISEAGSLGEASASCAAGAGPGISAGSAGWVTLQLRPGRYELVCNVLDHYARGMFETLVVS